MLDFLLQRNERRILDATDQPLHKPGARQISYFPNAEGYSLREILCLEPFMLECPERDSMSIIRKDIATFAHQFTY